MPSPILTIAVTAKKPIREVTEYTDKVLRRRLESADGVGQVLVLGGRKRQINVWVDCQSAARLQPDRQRHLADAAVAERRHPRRPHRRRARSRSRCAPAAASRRPEEFGDLVLRQVDGRPVQVKDVGRVDDGVAEATTLASINGDPTVLLQVRKQSGTNTVEVVNNVKERLADIQAALPPGYELRIVRDGAEFIEASIRSVEEHLVVGSVLAAFVVLLFLGNLRSTVIAAISIPTSIVATFALLWYMNFTLNMLTMLALTLSVGIVIDDAIVVLENIYRFIEEKGMSPIQAAIEGTRGDRPRGAGDDDVAGRDLCAGRLHERHGRPLHAQLRPDDGVRGDGVVAGRLHADTDDERAVAEGEAADRGRGSSRPRLEALEDLRADRSHLHADARVVDGASRHGRRARGAVLLSSVPMFRIVNINFTPQDDQSEFDVSLRAPEGTSLEATEVTANRVSRGDSPDSRGGLHDDHRRRRLGRHAQHGVALRAPEADRRTGPRQFEIMDQMRNEVLPKAAAPGM